MNRTMFSASAALLCLAAGSLPANAGDWNNGAGSLKDRGQAVVPVPAPYPVYDGPSGWYLRIDAGLGRESNHKGKESGLVYGAGNGSDSFSTTGDGFRSSSNWFSDSSDVTANYGIGVGYIWARNWRSDVTLDRRSTTEYKMRGTYQYQQNVVNIPGPPDYSPVPNVVVNGVTSDNTDLKSGVLLFNTYYDWANHSAFTPYIGLGIGLAYVDMQRQHTTSETECDVSVPAAPACTNRAGWSGSTSEAKILWAGSAQVGFSYAFTDVTSLDINYRFLYIPSANIDATVNGYQSRITTSEIAEHQLRAGLRWNIN